MAESSLLVAVAAHGLAGSRTDLPDSPLGDLEWFDLVQGCLAGDLVGFLAAAAAGGRLPVTPGQADELAALDAERAGATLLVEHRAVTVASVLAAAGIEHRVADGPARRLAYGTTGVRHTRRIHVLVPADRAGEAAALRGPVPAGDRGTTAHRLERVMLRAAPPGGVGSDDRQPNGTAPAGDGQLPAFGRLGPAGLLDVDGRRVAVLGLAQQLVVACADVASSPAPGLADLRDVAQIALSPGLDTAAARRLADAAGLTPALAEGVARAWRTFDLADKTELSVWSLRVGARADRPARPARPASPVAAATRPGLAQRVFGRLQPGPTAHAGSPPSAARAAPAGPHRSSRR